jgi:outer membrane immunogenic protein
MTSKVIKTIVTTSALLLMAPIVAEAADIPRPVYKGVPRSVIAYYNWTGFYAGVHAGYASGSSDWEFAAAPASNVSVSPKGYLFGLTLGYNWQLGSFVYGLEADYSFGDVNGETTCLGVLTCETKHSSLATFRGRIGYAFDRFLPYLTAGGAYGNIKASIPQVPLESSDSKFGWAAGAGIEYAFLGNWTAKLEYLYVDLGSFETNFFTPVTTNTVSLSENIIRVGLNYKFSGPVFGRY